MSELPIPTHPNELSNEWLTSALKSGNALKEAKVTSFRVQEFGEGVGFMGKLVRLTLGYDIKEENAPRTLVAKFKAEAPENLLVATNAQLYRREINFYRHIAPVSVLRVPIAYYLDIDENGQDFVMLLENLGTATVDQVEGAGADLTYKAVIELAGFHAQFIPVINNPEMDWLFDPASPANVVRLTGVYQASLEPALDNFGEHFTPEMKDLARAMASRVAPLIEERNPAGLTLIHGDYRLDNLFWGKLPPREGFPESGLAVVDWQICGKHECVFDLAYHMCSIDTDTRREIEKKALNDYYDALVSNGVTGYFHEDFIHNYRRAVLYILFFGILQGGTLDLANERGVKFVKANLDRTLSAIEDNNCAEVMPS